MPLPGGHGGQATIAADASDSREDQQIGLPMRLAGFGLRRSTDYAALAYLCSAAASASLFGFMSPLHLTTKGPMAEAALACPVLSRDPLVREQAELYWQGGGEFGDKKQRTLSALWDEHRFEELTEAYTSAGDLRSVARLVSCSTDGASAYLSTMYVAHARFSPWLSAPLFALQCKRRLGQPIAAEPSLCQCCNKVNADVLGDHASTCMAGGRRTVVHHAQVDLLFRQSSAALLHARKEVCPFPDEGLRVDWMTLRSTPQCVYDFSLVSATRSVTAMRAAAVTAGGAAAAMEMVKEQHYGAACAAADLKLQPVCVDTFGAWGPQAYDTLKRIAGGLAKRSGLSFQMQYQLVLLENNVLLMNQLAKLMIGSIGASEVPRTSSSGESVDDCTSSSEASATWIEAPSDTDEHQHESSTHRTSATPPTSLACLHASATAWATPTTLPPRSPSYFEEELDEDPHVGPGIPEPFEDERERSKHRNSAVLAACLLQPSQPAAVHTNIGLTEPLQSYTVHTTLPSFQSTTPNSPHTPTLLPQQSLQSFPDRDTMPPPTPTSTVRTPPNPKRERSPEHTPISLRKHHTDTRRRRSDNVDTTSLAHNNSLKGVNPSSQACFPSIVVATGTMQRSHTEIDVVRQLFVAVDDSRGCNSTDTLADAAPPPPFTLPSRTPPVRAPTTGQQPASGQNLDNSRSKVHETSPI
jgi:hypothetical protein